MSIEIERKFRVISDAYKAQAIGSTRITQGYLSSVPGRTVRVRIRGDRGYLTIKGASPDGGLSRYEWEHEIPASEASELMKLCEPGVIDKTRYIVPATASIAIADESIANDELADESIANGELADENLIFEVDEFYGDNLGLVMAEIELPSPDTSFPRPTWLGDEVTGDRRYYNSSLTKRPYKEFAQSLATTPASDQPSAKPPTR